jgi:predicted dehydrogenase
MADTDTPFRVAIIGTGRPRNADGSTGFGMAHAHAKGYNESGREIVALCDLVPERAEEFNRENADGKARVFSDYPQMLAEVKPDIVSVCTWPALHTPMVLACAEANVRAVHCEKPMAPTWGEAKAMHAAAVERGVQLTFNQQRRFLEPFRLARRLVQDGVIGELRRIEGACSDMIDWGTHWLDMFFFYNGETAADWVLGQIDSREAKSIFGPPPLRELSSSTPILSLSSRTANRTLL